MTAVIEQVTRQHLRLITDVMHEVANLIKALAEGDWAAAWKALEGIVDAFKLHRGHAKQHADHRQTVGEGILTAIKGTLETLNVDGAAIMEDDQSLVGQRLGRRWKVRSSPSRTGSSASRGWSTGLQTAIDNFRNWISGIHFEPPWANWKAPSLPGGFAIPGFQLGTTYARGGLATINEGGRGEIVMLPRGAAVIPHEESKGLLQGAGGVTVIMQNVTIGTERDSWRLANQIDELRRRRRS